MLRENGPGIFPSLASLAARHPARRDGHLEGDVDEERQLVG